MSEARDEQAEEVAAKDAADEPAEKRVSWAELFFDLVFVVAVTRVSALVEHDSSWSGVPHGAVVFVPVYWLWVGMSIQTNLLDAGLPVVRIRLFAVALAGVFMALALEDPYGHLGTLFACAYWAGRMVLATSLIRPLLARRGTPFNPYVFSVLITGPLLVIGSLLHGDARLLLWLVAAVLDLSTPTAFRSRLLGMHLDAGHLAERFGLFVLIALGESVVSVSTLAHDVDTATGFAVGIAFVLACGLWWVYFHFAADAMRHAMAAAQVQLDITRLVLSYGHLLFLGAVICVAVGLHESIAAPTHHLTWAATGLLFGGVAAYLAGFGFTRWAMFRLVATRRLVAAAVVLVAMPIAPHLPALASLSALAVVLIVLNADELRLNDSKSWRALLSLRSTT